MKLKYLRVILFLLNTVELINSQQCKEINDDNRLDCAPDKTHDSESCTERKCCYVENNTTNCMHCLFLRKKLINFYFFFF
jgi:hypothetical protein